jgi:hypothetical protein
MLLIEVEKVFITSSMLTGEIFSPPAVMISSLILPVMYKKPSESILPVSPEWK